MEHGAGLYELTLMYTVHQYLADSWVLAQMCNGLVEFHLLQR